MFDDDDEPEYDVRGAGGRPRMLSEMCATCILRPQSTVSTALRPGRLRQFLAEARRAESYVVCHSTFDHQPAICRGFADTYSTNYLRVMGRLGGFEEVPPPIACEQEH